MFLPPAFLYETFAEARKGTNRFLTALRSGKSLEEAAGPLIEISRANPGLVVLWRGGMSMIPSRERHFHLDLPWRRIDNLAFEHDKPELLLRAAEALEHAWAFAGLVASQFYWVVRTAKGQLRFLEAARRHWPALTSIGQRYTDGVPTGMSLSQLPTLVTGCLGRQGADMGPFIAGAPLTTEALESALAHLPRFTVVALLQRGCVDEATQLLRGRKDFALVSLAEHFLAFGLEDVACRAVEEYVTEDPHGIVAEWLAGRGNLARTVR